MKHTINPVAGAFQTRILWQTLRVTSTETVNLTLEVGTIILAIFAVVQTRAAINVGPTPTSEENVSREFRVARRSIVFLRSVTVRPLHS